MASASPGGDMEARVVDVMTFEALLDRMAALEQRGRYGAARRLLEQNRELVPARLERSQRARYFELTEGLSDTPGIRGSLFSAWLGVFHDLLQLLFAARPRRAP